MEIKLNKERLIDKIHGCWIGKNIGGTMGAPYEGLRKVLNIDGFATAKGEPLPNDDLDLQLVWLKAMEQVGPHGMSANVLSEYWLTQIAPHWNEYGICKANMQKGIMPPLSGELYNDDWRHSNGAWIRSEVWACLAPGFPNVAIKYAIMDAVIDHGISEGTIAEIFTAALESIAFVETNVRKIIETALSYIPENSRVAQTVRLVLNEYDKKTPYLEVREKVVETTADIGWFQAPNNIGFTVIGLMYGEGDMKKSLIYAINCGDDTDCTAATCGAILGIIAGAKNIPTELSEYIGDRIVTCSINASYYGFPKSCKELTERVVKLIPSVLFAQGVYTEYTDGEDVFDKEEAAKVLENYSLDYTKRSPLSFEVSGGQFLKAVVEYEKTPVVKPGDTFKVKVTYHHLYEQTLVANLDMILPEGWTSDCPRTMFVNYNNQKPRFGSTLEFTITVGEKVDAVNQPMLRTTYLTNPMPLCIPITLLG